MGASWSQSGSWQEAVTKEPGLYYFNIRLCDLACDNASQLANEVNSSNFGQDEVRDAVRGFEAWQKAQEDLKGSLSVQRSAPSTGPLLDRVGGPDAVKRMVEIFCRKLYDDEQLSVYLERTDMTSLRAKQSTFLTWLLGPRDRPNPSAHVRTAHLRLIKQRGFGTEHFELGLTHFEAALREYGLSEALVKEVMVKIRPYKVGEGGNLSQQLGKPPLRGPGLCVCLCVWGGGGGRGCNRERRGSKP
ncbi:hypothetical protein VOLCADRAFT_91319 [Volvox carteri f. nagariensis]|uniref:Uncharacterized protein n=1 Tax=Volvox carteri f. nagariensis TaxID=3068 RepID=D8TWR5_VOLCA|nr:uncharacterized protein VOLCADRAFT_91319 [Volvox carteri f. nagariensis]EFJ48195.1 hypothetical protein VOLCADRAFT_91319 [Volvox carteri f. nagariensis]|eukprot:XP_002950880.1 hypothetical protein VOLCADRAFT_91319 [Volvox carteri f. nagariensis]